MTQAPIKYLYLGTKMKKTIYLALIISLFLNPLAHAKTTIKLGVVTKPGSAQNVVAEKFKELLEKQAGNEFEVKIYHSASLGTETEILQQIQLGTVNMGVITLGPFDAFVPEVKVVNFPFLFKSYADVDKVLDGEPGQILLKNLEKAKFKGLAFSENGYRHYTNNVRAVNSDQDVKGLKTRVMESVFHKELWKTLGANPTPMGWPIYTELQQGTLDAQENPLWVISTYKLYEVQKHLSLTGHVYSAHIDVANLEWFNKLPETQQKLIQGSMKTAAKYERQWNRGKEASFLKELKDKGMQVIDKPNLDSFKAKVAQMKSLEMYQEAKTKALLEKFLAAAK
jgi:tripartite ATP-independent transporter DctP family solute receptor